MNTEISERQKEIINASLELIGENGIQSLTIKNLAKKIGFSESAIYRHYENKTQILLAILDFFDQNTEHLYRIKPESKDNALVLIAHIFQNHLNKFSATPSLVSVIFAEEMFRNKAGLTKKVREIMNKSIKNMESIVETGQKNCEIRSDVEASILAVIILGALRMFLKQWHISGYSFDLNLRGETLSDSIIKMIVNNN